MTTPIPVIYFPPELPVSQRKDDIARAIRDNQVVILAGETGSGKTTQLPKICLELGRRSIGHTQPRRIAARTIAERIAEELGEPVGATVGYQVRFTDRVGRDTKIKLMTDGILLNEIHRDRMLTKYDTIIIDEAHERSLNIDFLLGYLKQLLPRRPELKVIITSATIDPESFSKHFGGAPIVEVSGRTYPVETRYRPLVAESEADDEGPAADDRDYLEGITAALDELAREGTGDVLVFLSGENEIRDAQDAITSRVSSGAMSARTEVLPLYGRLSAADQHRVFQPSRAPGAGRRIVLATNVAETSLTVPGIKYVIDAGTARISRYSVRSKVQRLPIEAISQASANQRSGRSGRTSDGIAIRLYSEADFASRPEYTEPEILRTNLAAVILQMISLGLGDVAAFPFLQPPDARGIKDGLDLLTELGALQFTTDQQFKPDGQSGPRVQSIPEASPPPQRAGQGTPKLTKVGRDLALLPIDPRFARMVIESKRHGTSREVMAIVAGLTIQDPRERPLEKRPQADQSHARFADVTSDFLSLLNLWNHLEEKQAELSSSAFRRMCRAEYLNYMRVREWNDVYRQLVRLAKPLGLAIGQPSVNPDGIHRSLLAGLLSHIGLKDTRSAKGSSTAKRSSSARAERLRADYIGARQTKFVIFPGSTLAKKPPPALMSAELVETARLFARTNAAIDPAWAEPIAGDLVKRSYGQPRWEKKQGAAVVTEKVTLFGVPLIAGRRVQFSRIDPGYARELFIRHALVEGEWETDRLDRRVTEFDRANSGLRRELGELEERTRRRDILHDDETVFDFYAQRIPPDVCTTRGFESWWRTARAETPELLTMTAETLLPDDAPSTDHEMFPAQWQQGDQRLALGYRFEPGADDDGVTVHVPLPLLATLSPTGFDWQVPGLREELVTAMIKALPKAIRRNVVPAADWARRLLQIVPAEPEPQRSFAATLAQAITAQTGVLVTAADFGTERVPAHLKMTFQVTDDRGRVIGRDKDLAGLQGRFKAEARESVAEASARTPHALERSGLVTWDFEELPRTLDVPQGRSGQVQNVIRAYPTLVDENTSVSIVVMSTPEDQARHMPAGVRRLLLLTMPSPAAYVQQHLSQTEKLTLAMSPYPSTQALFDDCLVAVVDAGLRRQRADGMIFMRKEFETARDRTSGILMDSMFETVSLASRSLAAAREAQKAIKATTSMALLPALADAREQLANLIHPGFISATGLDQLRRLPVYLTGIIRRVGKLVENPGRDRAWWNDVQTATERYREAGGTLPLAPDSPAKIVHARWMLEELRLSLFAQDLGTAESVSLQRIQKVLAK